MTHLEQALYMLKNASCAGSVGCNECFVDLHTCEFRISNKEVTHQCALMHIKAKEYLENHVDELLDVLL